MIHVCTEKEAITNLIEVYRRAAQREKKHCTLVIDAHYVEFSTMYCNYKLQKYQKPMWPVASLPCHLRDIIEEECVSQQILDEFGEPWGYDWDAVDTCGMRVGEDELEIGCSDHGWITLPTLMEWIQTSDDFYCNLGLIIIQNEDTCSGERPKFDKFRDDLLAISTLHDVKVLRIR